MTSTRDLALFIIQTPIGKESEFRTPPGEGKRTVQRIRMTISRARNRLESLGRIPQRFRLITRIEESAEGDIVRFVRMDTQSTRIAQAADLLSRDLEKQLELQEDS